MLSFKHISAATGLVAIAHGLSNIRSTSSPQCEAAVNPTPQQCASEWLAMSNEASEAGFGNFWPPECGPPGPASNDYVVDTTNICGCVDGPLDYYPDVDHFGCKPGENPISGILEDYPWCFMSNGINCPAAMMSKAGLPAIRQCGGNVKQTGQLNAMGDKCEGDNCGYPHFDEFFKKWAKEEVYNAFESSGMLEKIMAAGPQSGDCATDDPEMSKYLSCGCDGPKCESYTIVLPEMASSESDETLPEDIDLEELAQNSVGFGVAYAGEMFDGRDWKTVGGTTTTASLPSCPNVGPVAIYNDGFPDGASGTSNIPPTPCLSVAPCISQNVYGEGIVFDGARTKWWFMTAEALLYFTE